MNETATVKRSSFADVLEIDFSIKIFGREIFHFHFPPTKE